MARDVAQMVAHVLWEHEVAGSNPVIPTTYINVNHGLGIGDYVNRLSEIYYSAALHDYDKIKIVSNSETILNGSPQIANLYLTKPSFEIEYAYKSTKDNTPYYEYLGEYWPAKRGHTGGDYIVAYACLCDGKNVSKCFSKRESEWFEDSLKDKNVVWIKDFSLDRNPFYRNKSDKSYLTEEYVDYLLQLLSKCKMYVGSECFMTHLCKAMNVPFACLDKRLQKSKSKYYHHEDKAFGSAVELVNYIRL